VISPLAASSSAAPTTFSPIRIDVPPVVAATAITGAKDTTPICYTIAATNGLIDYKTTDLSCICQIIS
jgi:hypothetical protein